MLYCLLVEFAFKPNPINSHLYFESYTKSSLAISAYCHHCVCQAVR